jgi:hypothetical protein
MLLAPTLLFAVLLTAPAQDKKDETAPIDPKRVEAAVAELDTAFKEGKSADERVAAIKKAVDVPDAKVIAAISKGLKDKDAPVQSAAVDALGHMQHPEALERLHAFYKSDVKRLKDDDKLLPLLFKSIGRHGDEKSVDILADDPFLQRTFPAIQARVMSLGNIRSTKSVKALIEMMNKAGPRQVNDYMNLFRQSLVRLTGADQGPDSTMWAKWWQDNKAKFEVPKDVPKMPEIAEKAWNEYWELTPKKADEPKPGGGEKKG